MLLFITYKLLLLLTYILKMSDSAQQMDLEQFDEFYSVLQASSLIKAKVHENPFRLSAI